MPFESARDREESFSLTRTCSLEEEAGLKRRRWQTRGSARHTKKGSNYDPAGSNCHFGAMLPCQRVAHSASCIDVVFEMLHKKGRENIKYVCHTDNHINVPPTRTVDPAHILMSSHRHRHQEERAGGAAGAASGCLSSQHGR